MSILLIGGTDPSGAGLQSDWQVTHYLQVQANSVVTAVTSQNAKAVFDQGIIPYQQLKSQLDSLQSVSFSAIKIGMLGNEQTIKTIIAFLEKQPSETAVILDPVLASSSGGELLSSQGIQALLKDLLPFVTLITPNTDELVLLTETTCQSYEDIEIGARKLLDLGAEAVLIKGGHFSTNELSKDINVYPNNNSNNSSNNSTDFFLSAKEQFYLQGKRWKNRSNVRGTGCALASSIACLLSKSYALNDAVVVSKALISAAIRKASCHSGQYKLYFSPPKNGNLLTLKDLPKVYKKANELNDQHHFKRCDTLSLGIYPVVDSVQWLKKLIPLGITTLQLRIKDKQEQEVESDIIHAINYAKQYKVRLFINDYWQLALKHKAYGIHLGQEDLDRLSNADLKNIATAGCHLGISTHSYTEVARAHALKPSYLALGPIFATTSKVMPWIPQGIKAVQNWVNLFGNHYPLVAIGGINLERAKALQQTGIGSVAMISEITQAEDYIQTTQALIDIFKKEKTERFNNLLNSA